METQTMIAGIRMENPLMNAAGTCKLPEDVRNLSRSAAAAIMVGSFTVEPRPGNIGNVYWGEPLFSLNSLGLPNQGAVYYKETLPTMVFTAHKAGKPLFASVAGFSPEEYANLAWMALANGAVDLVELNLGCPNVWQGGTQKRIACFDPALVAEILRCVEEKVGTDANVAVKISPFSDPVALAEVAEVIRASAMVKVVTSVNTFPNAFSYSGGKPSILPGGGLGGMAGPALKPIGLGQVKQLRELLPLRIQIIGVGGITHGQDVLDYLQAGAIAVQVGTAYREQGEGVFTSLLDEMASTSK